MKWKLVDAGGAEAAAGRPGELWVYVGTKRESSVPYWKNDKATNEKVVDGWLRTGDVMLADAKGFLYFVGRNTDSMRRRGENVSAYEVEKIVDAHPDVLESAAFGVPSPLGEQDIMVAVVPVAGKAIDARELAEFLRARLPKYAVPSYLEIVGELPKTGTHRVIKQELKARGVTGSTLRLEDGPRPSRRDRPPMREAFIVGVHTTKFGRYPDVGIKELAAQAVRGVLSDAALTKDELRSVWFSNSGWGMQKFQHCIRGQVALRPLGIEAIPITNVENACAGGSTALHGAWKDVMSGLCDVSLALGVEKTHQTNRYAVFAGFLAGTDVERAADEAARLTRRDPRRDRAARAQGGAPSGGARRSLRA